MRGVRKCAQTLSVYETGKMTVLRSLSCLMLCRVRSPSTTRPLHTERTQRSGFGTRGGRRGSGGSCQLQCGRILVNKARSEPRGGRDLGMHSK